MAVVLTFVGLLIAVMQGVFCNKWAVIMPHNIRSIGESCVTVPCKFEVPSDMEASVQNCSGGVLWRRNSLTGSLVFNSRDPFSNVIQGRLIGNVTKKNCTTLFYSFPKDHNDTYFLRLECEKLKFTFPDGLSIASQPVPPLPTVTSVSQVSEGDQVRVLCSVPVPCSILPPSLTWLPQDSSRQEETQMQQNADGQQIMTSTVTFIASANHHNQNIACSVSYPLTKGGSTEPSSVTRTLSVLYAPRFTVATSSPSGPVSEGRTVILSCSSDANPPVSRYTWYRHDSGALTKIGQGETLVLQMNQKDSGVYLCEAQSPRGSQKSRPVSLEVNAAEGSHEDVLLPYIICGVVLFLYILTVVVDLYKYKSLSKRLKQIELKGEHTYTNLRISSVSSDYDQLKLKTRPSPDYENAIPPQAFVKVLPQPNQT